ncbi:MAG: erythromycin esterase family protein, partial [Lachnospiraceae bacterium]|nr:erythromycin esterase family protein [Lachnospiraceae bacterium]
MKKKKKKRGLIVFLCILLILGGLGLVWSRFGGFGTGKSADPAEFAAYADSIEDMEIPEGTRIIALGEATHGNREFQQLKKDVFEQMVRKYKVRAFALEGDFGGCEYVNRYIHTGEGTAEEAAAAIGFAIYRTKEMADL